MSVIKFYREKLTSTDTDIFSGTEFETMPGDGILVIRAASTVNTALLAVKSERSPEISPARAITLRANGEIRAEDSPWVVPVAQGEKVTAALSGTTGTVYFEAQFAGV